MDDDDEEEEDISSREAELRRIYDELSKEDARRVQLPATELCKAECRRQTVQVSLQVASSGAFQHVELCSYVWDPNRILGSVVAAL